MQAPARDLVVGIAVLLCLGITLLNLAKHNDVLEHLEQQQQQEGNDVSTTWTSEGMTHTIRSSKLEGESPEDWMARHKTYVDAGKAVFPPDPPPPGE